MYNSPSKKIHKINNAKGKHMAFYSELNSAIGLFIVLEVLMISLVIRATNNLEVS